MEQRPSPDELFRIFLEIARFLREYADFETIDTPAFRHPPVMGGAEILKVGLLPELIDLKMHWGEVILDYAQYELEDFKMKTDI